jgi:putative ABC transport system ATP-binding protein
MDLMQAKRVGKTYAVDALNIPVLRDIDLTIQKGDFVGIVGPSGSGKSTLLYVLSGLEKVSSGSVSYLGGPFSELSDSKRAEFRKTDIGFVFQFYNLIPNLTVFENVEIAAVLAKRPSALSPMDVLAWVEMDAFANRYPHQLSGGQQQRVAIARALINRPSIVFADEPTGNLDTASGREIMELLRRMNREKDVTIVLVTHNPDHLEACTRIVRLLDGVIVADEARAV